MIVINNALFYQIPKTGSTSVSRALLANGGKQFDYQHQVREERIKPLQACTVRNTWDRVVSAWKHAGSSDTLLQFLIKLEKKPSELHKTFAKPQLHWAKHCDFILNFEHLETDWAEFLHRADVKHIELPRVNVGKRRDRSKSYREFFNDETYVLAAELFAEDIKRFNHTF